MVEETWGWSKWYLRHLSWPVRSLAYLVLSLMHASYMHIWPVLSYIISFKMSRYTAVSKYFAFSFSRDYISVEIVGPSWSLFHIQFIYCFSKSQLLDRYYEGGISSVYMWEDENEGFVACFLIKKGNGLWLLHDFYAVFGARNWNTRATKRLCSEKCKEMSVNDKSKVI